MKQVGLFKIVWHQNRFFFYLLTLLFTIGACPFFVFDKISFFILIKQWHHPLVDGILPYLTCLGDGVIYLFFVGIAALLRETCRKLIIMGGSFLVMSIAVQVLKRVLFTDSLRPIALLPLGESLHLVDGVLLLRDLSFPSGHAATIFVFVSGMQLFSSNKNKIYTIVWIGIALIVSYSRIYLCQHFYIDVYIGAWIGIFAFVVVYLFVLRLNRLAWLDRSIYCFLYR